VLLVRGKLRRKHNLTEEIPLAWIGSVVGKSRIVREAFYAGLRAGAPNMPILDGEVDGIVGSLWRANKLAE
jgi:hypothetical protein